MGVTYINSKNETNRISTNDDVNVFHKYCAPLLSSNNQYGVSTGKETAVDEMSGAGMPDGIK